MFVPVVLAPYFVPNTSGATTMFTDMPVFPVVGNHESFPVNMFPSSNETGKYNPGWLYTGLAEAFSHWLGEEAQQKTIRDGGYYQVRSASNVWPSKRSTGAFEGSCSPWPPPDFGQHQLLQQLQLLPAPQF